MKDKGLHVLLVEDNAGDARLLHEMFSTEKPGSFELTHLLRMSEASVHLGKGGVDVVQLDMGLPDAHGLDTVRQAHAMAPSVPLIVLTGLDDEALAAEAMKGGAQDYLIKAIPALAVIPIIVVSARDVLANKERALKAGAKAFLQKPVDNAELLKVIRRALGEPALTTKSVVHDLGSL
jgi:DNA-binding response OmpR family regulator